MSGNLDPYLYLNDELCLIYGEGLGNDASTISREGWPKIQSLAKEWSLLQIKPANEYYQYTLVYSEIAGKGEPFGQRHRKNKCCANFGKKSLLEKLQKIYITDSEGATCSSFLNDSFEIRGGADPPHPPLITPPVLAEQPAIRRNSPKFVSYVMKLDHVMSINSGKVVWVFVSLNRLQNGCFNLFLKSSAITCLYNTYCTAYKNRFKNTVRRNKIHRYSLFLLHLSLSNIRNTK